MARGCHLFLSKVFPVLEKSLLTGYILPCRTIHVIKNRVNKKVYAPLLMFFLFRRFSDLTISSKGSVTATVVRTLCV